MSRWHITAVSVSLASICVALAIGVLFFASFDSTSWGGARLGNDLFRGISAVLGEKTVRLLGAVILILMGLSFLRKRQSPKGDRVELGGSKVKEA